MAPTHSGATAPVRAQGPARYSVLEQGLQQQAPKRKLVTWGGSARRGGETGGPNSPGTRVPDRVGWERPGRIPGRGLNPSLPHFTLRELAVSSKSPGPAGAQFTKKIGCQGARVGRLRGLSGPRGGGGGRLPPPGTTLTRGRGRGNPWRPAPALRPAPGRRGGKGAGGGGDALPPARGLALAHPSRPGRAARGLAGPRGCSWALLETSNAGSDSSPTARMQEPPLPPPRHPTPPPPAEPERRGRASERASDRASEPGSGPRAGLQRASPGPARAAPTDPRPRAARGRARAAAGPTFSSAPGAARQEPREPTSTRTLDSHAHTHTRSSHVDGETKTRTEPRKLEARSNAGPRRCAGWLGRRWPKQERRNSRGRTFPEAAKRQRGGASTHWTDEKTEARQQGSHRELSPVVTKEHTRGQRYTSQQTYTNTEASPDCPRSCPPAPPADPRKGWGRGGALGRELRPGDRPSQTPGHIPWRAAAGRAGT